MRSARSRRGSYGDVPYQWATHHADERGKGPFATPALADGILYTYGVTQVLSAYEAASGQLLWRQDQTLPFGTSASPIIGAGSGPARRPPGTHGVALVPYFPALHCPQSGHGELKSPSPILGRRTSPPLCQRRRPHPHRHGTRHAGRAPHPHRQRLGGRNSLAQSDVHQLARLARRSAPSRPSAKANSSVSTPAPAKRCGPPKAAKATISPCLAPPRSFLVWATTPPSVSSNLVPQLGRHWPIPSRRPHLGASWYWATDCGDLSLWTLPPINNPPYPSASLWDILWIYITL